MSAATMRNELLSLKSEIDHQIGVLRGVAHDANISVYLVQNMGGDYMINVLLLAKSNILLALTNLEKS